MKYHLRALNSETNELVNSLDEYPPIVADAVLYIEQNKDAEIQAVGVLEAWDGYLVDEALEQISDLFNRTLHYRLNEMEDEPGVPFWTSDDRAWINEHGWVVVSEEELLG